MTQYFLFFGDKSIGEVKPFRIWVQNEQEFCGFFEFYMRRGTVYYFRGELGKIKLTSDAKIELQKGKKYKMKGKY